MDLDKLDDKSDIISKRNSLCAKIKNVLCYFGNRDPAVKLKLLIHCTVCQLGRDIQYYIALTFIGVFCGI